MKIYNLLFCLALAASASAQTKSFNYNFGNEETIFNIVDGKPSSTTFLPKITDKDFKSVKNRVRMPSNGTGAIKLVKNVFPTANGAAIELEGGDGISKVSFYGLPLKTTAVFKFDVQFNEANAAWWAFGIGTADDASVFQNETGFKNNSNELFAAIKLKVQDTKDILLSYKEGEAWKNMSGNYLEKNKAYKVSIYANNGKSEIKYTHRPGQEVKLAPGSFHIYIDDNQIGKDFKSGGLDLGDFLNGFTFYGSSIKKPIAGKAWLDNFEAYEIH